MQVIIVWSSRLLYGFSSVGGRQTSQSVVEKPHGAHFTLSPLHPPITATDAVSRRKWRIIVIQQHHERVRPIDLLCATTSCAVHYFQTERRFFYKASGTSENKSSGSDDNNNKNYYCGSIIYFIRFIYVQTGNLFIITIIQCIKTV